MNGLALLLMQLDELEESPELDHQRSRPLPRPLAWRVMGWGKQTFAIVTILEDLRSGQSKLQRVQQQLFARPARELPRLESLLSTSMPFLLTAQHALHTLAIRSAFDQQSPRGVF